MVLPKPFTLFFLIFMIVMGAQRIWETFFSKRNKETGVVIKKWTLPLLSITHFGVAFVTVIEYFVVRRQIDPRVSLVGLSLFLVAYLLRTWSIRSLGPYHSIHIEIRERHPIIRRGPYRYMRHPYYTAVALELLGVPLVANSYLAFFMSLFIYCPLLLVRVYFEEKAMMKKLGHQYDRYRNETWGLTPTWKIPGSHDG